MVSVWGKTGSRARAAYGSRCGLFSLAFTLAYYQLFSFEICEIPFPRFVIILISEEYVLILNVLQLWFDV